MSHLCDKSNRQTPIRPHRPLAMVKDAINLVVRGVGVGEAGGRDQTIAY